MAAANAITNAVPIPYGEDLHGQSIPGLDDAMLDSADIIVVLGDDLAGAPWEAEGTPLIDQGIGTLLVVDATTTAAGHDRAEQRAQQLRADGVAVADVVNSTRPVEVSNADADRRLGRGRSLSPNSLASAASTRGTRHWWPTPCPPASSPCS